MSLHAAGVRLGSLECGWVWISPWSHSCGCWSSLGNCLHRTWPSDSVQRSVVPQGAKQQIGACAAGWECFIEEPGFSEITIQSIADPTEVPYRGSLPIKLVAELRLQLQKPKKDPGGSHYVINK